MRVVVTGAAGRIGRTLLPGLTAAGHEVRGVDLIRPDTTWADDVVVADIANDDSALLNVLANVEAVVHLAANPGETDFETAVHSHIRMTHRVLEQARTAGVQRVIYASSHHAVGFTPRTDMVPASTMVRPDTFYGVGKAAAEALCSLHHDRYGVAVACLRIGSFRDQPATRRHLSTWLSPTDLVRLVEACLQAPDLGFAVVYGTSANTRRWWDLSSARQLGYEPLDDAERWAEQIEASPSTDTDDLDARYVGGDFTRLIPARDIIVTPPGE